jgi:hypothetical protein
LPRALSHPAKFSASGKNCRVTWANTSTFQKSNAQKIQQNQGKYWFTPVQGSVNKCYGARPVETRRWQSETEKGGA